MKKKYISTFGEIMLRLSCPNNYRIIQTDHFIKSFAGSEANVAVNLSYWGLNANFITGIPSNELGTTIKANLREYNVNLDYIIENEGRLGLFFLEPGNNQRSSQVIYDRRNSIFSETLFTNAFFEEAFENSSWFHWSGITPALSKLAYENCIRAINIAKRKGIIVSADLNYRKILMENNEDAILGIQELLKLSDIIIGNEEDFQKILKIKIPKIDFSDTDGAKVVYENICQKTKELYPNLQSIAITLRSSVSANHNKWSAMMFVDNSFLYSKQYEISNIIDRVGSGDAFSSGIIYGLINFKNDYQKTLDFATSASCLKHSIFGDFCLISPIEILSLMEGNGIGRINR